MLGRVSFLGILPQIHFRNAYGVRTKSGIIIGAFEADVENYKFCMEHRRIVLKI